MDSFHARERRVCLICSASDLFSVLPIAMFRVPEEEATGKVILPRWEDPAHLGLRHDPAGMSASFLPFIFLATVS